MDILKTGLLSLGYLIVFISLLPLVRLDYWFFRVFEYPRIQKLVLNLLIITFYLSFFYFFTIWDNVFIAAQGLNLCYLFYQILPFTVFNKKQVIQATSPNNEKCISLFIANVYQYNRQAADCLKLLNSVDPDVVMLVETDNWWADQVKALKKTHPYQVLIPQENTYGMLLYSKLELIDEQVKFLVEKDIPSVHTCVKLRSGDIIRLFGLHPMPPVPGENPRSTERDKEILMVAKEARECKLPVIVAGDLNDVAWSYTTQLFSRTSGLLDPRRGRGFYNTFHAKHPLMRFPLDHIFCLNVFTLVNLKRMPNCGSDHFPIFIKLHYEPQAAAEQKEPEADQGDLETAGEKINEPT